MTEARQTVYTKQKHTYNVLEKVKSKRHSRWVGCQGLGVGKKINFKEFGVNFIEWEKVLNLDCACGCMTIYICHSPSTIILKWVNFVLCKPYLSATDFSKTAAYQEYLETVFSSEKITLRFLQNIFFTYILGRKQTRTHVHVYSN